MSPGELLLYGNKIPWLWFKGAAFLPAVTPGISLLLLTAGQFLEHCPVVRVVYCIGGGLFPLLQPGRRVIALALLLHHSHALQHFVFAAAIITRRSQDVDKRAVKRCGQKEEDLLQKIERKVTQNFNGLRNISRLSTCRIRTGFPPERGTIRYVYTVS